MTRHHVNRAWRVLATGFCFIVFGLGGLLYSLTVAPALCLLPLDRKKRNAVAQQFIHHGFRLFVQLMQVLGVLHLTVIGTEKLKQTDARLIVANHPTLIDVVLLIALVGKTGCIVKRDLWRNPFLRGVVSSAGYISNCDPERLINDCADYLNQGHSMIIFPEGTRTVPDHRLNKLQRGAANIALRADTDLLPVVITCTPPSLTKRQRWYHVPPEGPMYITLRVAEPISATPCSNRANAGLAARKLTHSLEQFFQLEIPRNEQFDPRDQRADYPVPGT